MNIYEVSFVKNGIYQCNLVKTEKSPVEVGHYFRDERKVESVLGVYDATADDMKPGKPFYQI